MKYLCITWLTLSLFLSAFGTLSPRPTPRLRTIVLDAGHGGRDPGNLGKNTREKDITLKVCLELGRIIRANMPNVEVVYTRNTDKFVELHQRPKFAIRHEADLFISIHCNAAPKNYPARSNIAGTETYILGTEGNAENMAVAMQENAAIYLEEDYRQNYPDNPNSPETYILLNLQQRVHVEQSLSLARKVEYQFKHHTKRKSRGVKQAGFAVLSENPFPSVLIELGFLSNLEEEKFLSDNLGQIYMASAIFRAIREYKKEIER